MVIELNVFEQNSIGDGGLINDVYEQQGFLFGGDYNPEQWPESTWDHDIQLLLSANVNTVTLNIFSWILNEPAEGVYDFTLLDKIIDHVTKFKLKIIMATSTAALPLWLTEKYPDVMRTDANGIHQGPGKRHNACPNSVNFQEAVKKLVTATVTHVQSNNSEVCLWHVSNEYGGQCYCNNCKRAFQKWLKSKYSSLDELNEQWNTNFWSHRISSWNEIYPPLKTTDIWNKNVPTLMGCALDYRRFQSESILNNYRLECSVIRQFDQETPITTNLMATQFDLDYFEWAKDMDVISWDSYPNFQSNTSDLAFNHDLMYGLKKVPFLLMEQTPTQQTWDKALKRPGEMRMQSYIALAHGANSIQFFQMKQSRNAKEKFHGAIIPHVNNDKSRSFREVQNLGSELKKLPRDLLQSVKHNKIAIMFDWNNYWAFEYLIENDSDVDYRQEVSIFYKILNQMHIEVDIVHPRMNLSSYEIIFAPFLYSVDAIVKENIDDYVAQGGTFVTNYMSGMVDEHDNIYMGGYPGAFKKLSGIWVEENYPMQERETGKVITPNGEFLCNKMASVIHLTSAKAIGIFGTGNYFAGMPAITRNKVNKGEFYYIGTQLSESGFRNLFEIILRSKGLQSDLIIPKEVEILNRYSNSDAYHFIINTSDKKQTFTNPFPDSKEVIGSAMEDEILTMDEYGVLVSKESL